MAKVEHSAPSPESWSDRFDAAMANRDLSALREKRRAADERIRAMWLKFAADHPELVTVVSGDPSKLAVPEGSTLAGSARTDDPTGVPMSGGAEPAGAAKPSPAKGAGS